MFRLTLLSLSLALAVGCSPGEANTKAPPPPPSAGPSKGGEPPPPPAPPRPPG